MKKLFTLIAILLSISAYSQEMKVHKTNGSVESFLLSTIDSITFTNSTQGVNIPLTFNNWSAYAGTFSGQHYVLPSPGVFEIVAEGFKLYGTGYREGLLIHPTPINNYLTYQKSIFLKWKANGGGNFMGVGSGLITDTISVSWIGTGLTNLTTDHSYAGSYLITDDLWYYTRIVVNNPTDITCTTSIGNYDIYGGTVIQSMTKPWDMDYKYFDFGIWDCYASNNAFAILGEVIIKDN